MYTDAKEREEIYRLRYQVYACELHRHGENEEGMLQDRLDAYNTYFAAFTADGILAGFVSVTPPGKRYSLDKYRERGTKAWIYQGAYENRILTVREAYRGGGLAPLLLEEAARYVAEQKGQYILSIGREELMPYYERLGFIDLQEVYQAGQVRFHFMFHEPERLYRLAAENARERLERAAGKKLERAAGKNG